MTPRNLPVPSFLSPAAQAQLQSSAGTLLEITYPALEDKLGWRTHVAAMDAALLPLLEMITPEGEVKVEERSIGAVRVFDVTPARMAPDCRGFILDMHAGGLILCGGKCALQMAKRTALRYRMRVLSIDFRMAPDHPYPAALDDGIAVYQALLSEYQPSEIVFHGESGGGNLIAAMLLRARDEGMPLPAGLMLNTPEVDLTESGDSFHTNLGVDPGLRPLMPVNLLYANGNDLAHPYLSPLFGDFTQGFPPTLLTTGTRDLFLSNTVRMHRALRDAGIEAELHVVEAAPHGNFPGTPEGESVDKDARRFIQSVLHRTR